MSEKLNSIFERILAERARQRTLPGSEFDSTNKVNDWLAIASHYLSEPAQRNSSADYHRLQLTQADYEDSLIKAAAVILAALEHSDALKAKGDLA